MRRGPFAWDCAANPLRRNEYLCSSRNEFIEVAHVDIRVA